MEKAYAHLASLLKQNSFKKVLDLGAGKGYGALLAASYRTTVDAVDNISMPMWTPPSFILDHKYITYIKEDITSYINSYTGEAYDMVMMINVLHFLGANYLLSTLVPFLEKKITHGGYAIINYYLADDPVFFSTENQHKHTAYSLEDFSTLTGFTMTESTEFWMDDFDPKSGKHQHHVGLAILKRE